MPSALYLCETDGQCPRHGKFIYYCGECQDEWRAKHPYSRRSAILKSTNQSTMKQARLKDKAFLESGERNVRDDKGRVTGPSWCHEHERSECAHIENEGDVEALRKGAPLICCHTPNVRETSFCSEHQIRPSTAGDSPVGKQG